jgi:hypothetical protein
VASGWRVAAKGDELEIVNRLSNLRPHLSTQRLLREQSKPNRRSDRESNFRRRMCRASSAQLLHLQGAAQGSDENRLTVP